MYQAELSTLLLKQAKTRVLTSVKYYDKIAGIDIKRRY